MVRKGLFSERLLAIEIELDSLIQSAGGTDGLKFLDRLGSLSESDRDIALKVCTALLDKFAPLNESSIKGEKTEVHDESPRLKVIAGGRRA